jgi:hypothetical protein
VALAVACSCSSTAGCQGMLQTARRLSHAPAAALSCPCCGALSLTLHSHPRLPPDALRREALASSQAPATTPFQHQTRAARLPFICPCLQQIDTPATPATATLC